MEMDHGYGSFLYGSVVSVTAVQIPGSLPLMASGIALVLGRRLGKTG